MVEKIDNDDLKVIRSISSEMRGKIVVLVSQYQFMKDTRDQLNNELNKIGSIISDLSGDLEQLENLLEPLDLGE